MAVVAPAANPHSGFPESEVDLIAGGAAFGAEDVTGTAGWAIGAGASDNDDAWLWALFEFSFDTASLKVPRGDKVEHLSLCPLSSVQDQVHGPVPSTSLAVPEAQRFLSGACIAINSAAEPHVLLATTVREGLGAT